MILSVNNREIKTEAKHLSELAIELSLPAAGVAIAVENKLVVRTEWEKFLLAEGMQIVIIKAVCGG